MNQRPDDDLDEWDAAYVLGALSLEERRTYESYLAANPAHGPRSSPSSPGCPAFSMSSAATKRLR